jgi:hypothetical protein
VYCQKPGIRILTDKRRNQIRTFWQKAGKITRELDGHAFTLADWESYLSYISSNCRGCWKTALISALVARGAASRLNTS